MKDELEQQLRLAETKKTGSYDKRTEHLAEDGSGLFINRLILEDSPYLLQHAHNPVDWWAWGDDAFAAATQQNKPIFLSIGYSTCHWCHVMEVESFDNVEVAKLLNKYFISIKMDREQYPDIDEVYMTGVQLMSGQGGWPMSNFLLPDGKPFFGATYFPSAGFMNLLQQVSEAWAEKELELITSARSISASIDRVLSERKDAVNLDGNILQNTLQALYKREDRSLGGLAGAPKFPQEPLLLLLLDRVRRDADLEAMGFIERALEGMACGGIYDQVAGGFSRYSVDAQWLVPHFEKMLYNQSQLSLVYLEAYQLTNNTFFRRVCEQTLDYVLRDMQIEEGGFYSATDADSEGIEGQFFVWSLADIAEVLSKTELDLVVELYGISEFGNFEGSNILNLSIPLNETAEASGNTGFYADLDNILEKLYLAREQRIHPLRDDKLITAWAAAMITSLGKASVVLDRPEYLLAAERAAQLIWRENVDGDDQLQRIYLNGTVSIAGQLEDYAHLCEACVVLFDVTSKAEYLSQAARLMNSAIEGFWSEEHKSFYLSPRQQAGPQITRSSNAGDGATLSPVAIIVSALIMLQQRATLIPASLSAQERESVAGVERLEQFYSDKINSCFASLSANIDDSPLGHASMLRVITQHRDGSAELLRYVDGGRAAIEMKRLSADEATNSLRVEVAITLADGWHITAPMAQASEQGAFVPLGFTVAQGEANWVLNGCDFPVASGTLGVAGGNEIAIYQGRVSFVCELSSTQASSDSLAASAAVSLQLQLCNDEVCSLPHNLSFRV